jgi:hypothetical protein
MEEEHKSNAPSPKFATTGLRITLPFDEATLDDDEPWSPLSFDGDNIQAGILHGFKTVLSFKAYARQGGGEMTKFTEGLTNSTGGPHAEEHMIPKVIGAIPMGTTEVIVLVAINNSPCGRLEGDHNCTGKLETAAASWCAQGMGRTFLWRMNYENLYKPTAKDVATRYANLTHLTLEQGVDLDETDIMNKMSAYHGRVMSSGRKVKGTMDTRMKGVAKDMQKQGFAMEEFEDDDLEEEDI